MAHADAHQRHLAAIAYAHFTTPPGSAALPAPAPASSAPTAGSHDAPALARQKSTLTQVRIDALKERCRQALGARFPPVYEYLRRARADELDNGAVRIALGELVGRDRINDCMCVDELIFMENV